MKNKIILFLSACIFLSCKSRQEEALKSADKEFILQVANEQFAKKKWAKSLALYERLSNLVAGTDDAPNVLYNSAYANYYDKNYQLAGHQFKNFSVTFPKDARREDALYMSALCYYQGSMEYNLDQTSTLSAIDELQNFLNQYPNSEKAKNIDKLIDELSFKIEFKAFENARQYHKMANYKAADIAMENFLEDFPASKLKTKALDIQMESKYELAMHSAYELKEERIEKALNFAKNLEKELPNTPSAITAKKMSGDLLKERTNFAKLKKETEEIQEKLKKKQEQNAVKEAEKSRQNTRKALMDSAKVNTPTPAVSLPIKN